MGALCGVPRKESTIAPGRAPGTTSSLRSSSQLERLSNNTPNILNDCTVMNSSRHTAGPDQSNGTHKREPSPNGEEKQIQLSTSKKNHTQEELPKDLPRIQSVDNHEVIAESSNNTMDVNAETLRFAPSISDPEKKDLSPVKVLPSALVNHSHTTTDDGETLTAHTTATTGNGILSATGSGKLHNTANFAARVQSKNTSLTMAGAPALIPSSKMSLRAQEIVKFVNNIFRRCDKHELAPNEPPVTEEEMHIYREFVKLRNSPIGHYFVNHPEVTLSNRCCVITAPDFQPYDVVDVFRLLGAFDIGTVGRTYYGEKDNGLRLEAADQDTVAGLDGESPYNAPLRKKSVGEIGSLVSLNYQNNDEINIAAIKVVGFVLRKNDLDAVLNEQRALVNLSNNNVLKIYDVLNDDDRENMIILTKCHKRNVTCYAGQLDSDPDKLRRIIYDVAVGLRIIHSHCIYHHNLKLENVLEKEDNSFCIADTGLSKLFTSQCPESLVFNGELACIPPEVFDEKSRYGCPDASEEIMGRTTSFAATTSSEPEVTPTRSRSIDETRGIDSAVAKVDIWGFGIFMYRLAYGKDPFVIAQCTYEEACAKVMKSQLEFPAKEWPFAKDLEDAISWCMEKTPERRPTILRLLKHPLFHSIVPPRRTTSLFSNTISSGGRPTSAAGVSVANLTGAGGKTQTSQYTFDTRLGTGRWSETILVRPRYGTQEFQAFKIVRTPLQKRLEKYSDIADDIRRQLAISRKIKHDNIVSYLDIVDSRQGCFVVQEYMKHGCIQSVPSNVRTKGEDVTSLPLFLRDVLTALAVLHENGIAHLILTPSNIFYSQETNTYRVSDFGPLFLTPEEITDQYKNGTPVYALPEWITAKETVSGYDVDMFLVGLLAASSVPSIFSSVWEKVTHPTDKTPFDVDGLLQKLEDPQLQVPRKVAAFIRTALTKETTPHKLFQMPLMEHVQKKFGLLVKKISVSEEEMRNAVHIKPESRFEARMQEALGHDPLISCNDAFNSEADETSISFAADKTVDFTFKGAQITCGQCGAEVPYAFYLCPQCPNFVRCGKCAMNHPHKETHELVPYLVYVVETINKDEKRASLVHPSAIKDVHSLETLEMCANIPVGSLTKYVTATRGKAELTSRLGLGLGKTMTSVCDGSEWSSVYSTNLKPFTSTSQNNHFGVQLQSIEGGLSPKSMNLGMSSFNVAQSSNQKGGLLAKFKSNNATGLSGGLGGGAGVGGFGAGNNGSMGLLKQNKKMALPKEWEVDIGITWQQVVDSCRFEAAPDLNLHQLHLVEVPSEIYNPPLLHVVNLTLSQNSLVTLPHELSFLKNLRKLIVSYNELETLPESLGNLLQLESLDASHNKLSVLPQNFVYLTNLELVVLDYNNFSEVPECLLDILCAPVGVPSIEEQCLTSTTEPRPNSQSNVVEVADLSPALRVIYLVANNSITTFPDIKRLERFTDLSLSFDNEPSLYRYYMNQDLEKKLPNITMKWNKIYPDEIIPHLYCGALRSAQSQIVYKKLNITYLLTVGRDLTPTPPEGGKHRVIVVDDIPGADIFSSFKEAIDFIDESQRREQGCLVHCFAGLSRSATTVIAYLMAKKKMRLDEAYLVTKKGRPAILPNKSFLEQLIQLDKELFPDDKRPLDLKSLGRQDV